MNFQPSQIELAAKILTASNEHQQPDRDRDAALLLRFMPELRDMDHARALCVVVESDSAPVVKVCGHCGSSEVTSDAAAVWDVGAQDWLMSDVHCNTDCQRCMCESSLDDAPALLSIDAIKAAVDAGQDVRCDGGGYRVIKDGKGQYLIKNADSYCIGLHGQPGTEYADRLNGTGFYALAGGYHD